MSSIPRMLSMATKMVMGNGLDFTTGVVQGATGTEHVQTGLPSLAGQAGALLGRTGKQVAMSYALRPTEMPRYNTLLSFEQKIMPDAVIQHATTKSMGSSSISTT
ncbi:MAG: hypothetical protein Kow0022_08370 [Phycisphaerales bacterium]